MLREVLNKEIDLDIARRVTPKKLSDAGQNAFLPMKECRAQVEDSRILSKVKKLPL